jgi:hypothetical protein
MLRLLVSALLIWCGIRGGLLFLGIGPWIGWLEACGLVLLTAALAFFDVRRRCEHLFLENLGVSRATVFLLVTVPPLLLESACAVVSRT